MQRCTQHHVKFNDPELSDRQRKKKFNYQKIKFTTQLSNRILTKKEKKKRGQPANCTHYYSTPQQIIQLHLLASLFHFTPSSSLPSSHHHYLYTSIRSNIPNFQATFNIFRNLVDCAIVCIYMNKLLLMTHRNTMYFQLHKEILANQAKRLKLQSCHKRDKREKKNKGDRMCWENVLRKEWAKKLAIFRQSIVYQ